MMKKNNKIINLLKYRLSQLSSNNNSESSAGTTDIIGLPNGTLKLTDYLPADPENLDPTFKFRVSELFSLFQNSLPYAKFTPVIIGSENLSSAIPMFGRYSGNKTTLGGQIDVKNKFLIVCNNASNVCKLTLKTPILTNFVDDDAAEIDGLPSFVENSLDEEQIGNTGAGWNKNLFANVGGDTIDFWFEVAQSGVEYVLDMSYSYEIQ